MLEIEKCVLNIFCPCVSEKCVSNTFLCHISNVFQTQHIFVPNTNTCALWWPTLPLGGHSSNQQKPIVLALSQEVLFCHRGKQKHVSVLTGSAAVLSQGKAKTCQRFNRKCCLLSQGKAKTCQRLNRKCCLLSQGKAKTC